MQRNVTIADALYNMVGVSGATDEYRKGIIVGLAAGIMANNLSFDQAMTIIAYHMPDAGARVFPASVPETWVESITTRMSALGKRWVCPV